MDLYTPISQKEVLKALVYKFGAAEVLRYFLANALSDISSIETGIGDNNPLLAVKSVESLRENLSMAKSLVDNKGNKPQIEGDIKNNLDQ